MNQKCGHQGITKKASQGPNTKAAQMAIFWLLKLATPQPFKEGKPILLFTLDEQES